jgi:hypothetical protein
MPPGQRYGARGGSALAVVVIRRVVTPRRAPQPGRDPFRCQQRRAAAADDRQEDHVGDLVAILLAQRRDAGEHLPVDRLGEATRRTERARKARSQGLERLIDTLRDVVVEPWRRGDTEGQGQRVHERGGPFGAARVERERRRNAVGDASASAASQCVDG